MEEWQENVRCFLKGKELSLVTYGIRCKISFALLRSCLLCIRGSRKSNNEYEKANEISFNAVTIMKRNDN